MTVRVSLNVTVDIDPDTWFNLADINLGHSHALAYALDDKIEFVTKQQVHDALRDWFHRVKADVVEIEEVEAVEEQA